MQTAHLQGVSGKLHVRQLCSHYTLQLFTSTVVQDPQGLEKQHSLWQQLRVLPTGLG